MVLINLKEALINPSILTNFNGIKLRSNWQFNFTGWQLVPNERHEDSCAIWGNDKEKLEWLEDKCNCNSKVYYNIVSKILAYPIGEPKREYHQVTLTEYPTDIRLMLDTPAKFVNEQDDMKLAALINNTPIKDWPRILWEDLQNAISTIHHYLKYNEATGKVLTEQDFFEGKKEILDIIYDKN